MNKNVYPLPKTFSRYDNERVMVYLNEQKVEGYVPDNAPEGTKPISGYTYTGTEPDGGTLIYAMDESRDELINGIIRSRYSQTEEDAIKTHQIIALQNPRCAKSSEYASEWAAFCVERENAIATVDRWLSK